MLPLPGLLDRAGYLRLVRTGLRRCPAPGSIAMGPVEAGQPGTRGWKGVGGRAGVPSNPLVEREQLDLDRLATVGKAPVESRSYAFCGLFVVDGGDVEVVRAAPLPEDARVEGLFASTWAHSELSNTAARDRGTRGRERRLP